MNGVEMAKPEGIKIRYSVELELPQGVLGGAGVPGLQQLMSSVTNGNQSAIAPHQYQHVQPALPPQTPQLALPPAQQSFAYAEPSYTPDQVWQPPDYSEIIQQQDTAPVRGYSESLKAVKYGMGLGFLILAFIFVVLNRDSILSVADTAKSSNATDSSSVVSPAAEASPTADSVVPANKAAGSAPKDFDSEKVFKPALSQ
jgi:hypothetical protein